MPFPPQQEIFLHPGQYFFGDGSSIVRTVLGSCVSVTMWHPRLRLGGMCHLVTPHRKTPGHIRVLDGHFGHEAVLWLFKEISARTTNPYDYVVNMFGGGRMFRRSAPGDVLDVGARNVAYLTKLLQDLGFRIASQDVGDYGSRQLAFDIATGQIDLRRQRDALSSLPD